jgi:serine/threonine protein kinase
MAVKSCSMKNIYHRDIKPVNILVNIEGYKNEINLYLSDFGEAMQLGQGVKILNTEYANKPKKLAGSITYMAPEMKQSHING